MSRNDAPGPKRRPALRLYLAGNTPGGRRALQSRARLIAEADGRIDIEVVDVLAHPEEAENAGILATPTLSDESVSPPRRLVGDISDRAQVLEFFGIPRKEISP